MTNLRAVDVHPLRQEAESALKDLKEALSALGITLPSIELDHLSLLGPHIGPLIDLGRVNLDTARKLTEALRSSNGR